MGRMGSLQAYLVRDRWACRRPVLTLCCKTADMDIRVEMIPELLTVFETVINVSRLFTKLSLRYRASMVALSVRKADR